ncbi:MAG: universal stress protein [Oscillatoriales cyanobacterium SM2_1_8]|nr:universal stress protein [Oscillatoriales cyanobacterium SM2_1_8]
MFDTILFPVDRSPESEQAAAWAMHLAQTHRAQVVMITAILEEGDRPVATAFLQEVATRFEDEGLTVATRVVMGKPAFAICDVAEEYKSGLIVMGSRGQGSPADGTESVSHKTIDFAPCPVLVVP